ncbi:hypothetical protein [Paraburkholderia sp. SIMBA_054]|uniref:hypothetical protein n=1 Tax=Paraburkholderia sp. SIMBA_054 TaxID=3085795 RepID=UPI00397883CE
MTLTVVTGKPAAQDEAGQTSISLINHADSGTLRGNVMKKAINKLASFVRSVSLMFSTPTDARAIREICDFRFAMANKAHSVVLATVAIAALGFVYVVISSAMFDLNISSTQLCIGAVAQTFVLLSSFAGFSWYYSAMCNPEAILARRRVQVR